MRWGRVVGGGGGGGERKERRKEWRRCPRRRRYALLRLNIDAGNELDGVPLSKLTI